MNPRSFAFLILFGLSPFYLSACASLRAKKAPEPQPAATEAAETPPEEIKQHPIGTISVINEDLGFVLIEARETLPENTPLAAVNASGMKTAQLLVSGEKQPPFLIADIVEGNPFVGDQIIIAPKKN